MTRVLIWAIVILVILYFIFIPIDFIRQKPQTISPVKIY